MVHNGAVAFPWAKETLMELKRLRSDPQPRIVMDFVFKPSAGFVERSTALDLAGSWSSFSPTPPVAAKPTAPPWRSWVLAAASEYLEPHLRGAKFLQIETRIVTKNQPLG